MLNNNQNCITAILSSSSFLKLAPASSSSFFRRASILISYLLRRSLAGLTVYFFCSLVFCVAFACNEAQNLKKSWILFSKLQNITREMQNTTPQYYKKLYKISLTFLSIEDIIQL